ncbi:hypothetical protein VNI00_004841 [Paramarasmius palmivorus]|uniref:Uncharacterized protein n=1 Tax=Paramarasmius palmivorus TaxID=297713 RepID=A0AAW0DI20_9AGAR
MTALGFIINTFSVIFITAFISFTIMGIIAFITWITGTPQPPPFREVVESSRALPTYEEAIHSDNSDVNTVAEVTPSSDITDAKEKTRDRERGSKLKRVKLFTKPLGAAAQDIKNISRSLTRSLRRTQVASTAPFSKEKQSGASSTSSLPSRPGLNRTFTRIANTFKLTQSSSSAIEMVREISNGHCREVILSEEALGMSRQLSSNRALCTGW